MVLKHWKYIVTSVLIVTISISVLPYQQLLAQSVPPAIFIGKAYYNGIPVVAGSEIKALIHGHNVGSTKTSSSGKFTLVASGEIGDTVRFSVNGKLANEYFFYYANGLVEKMNLTTNLAVLNQSTSHADNSVETNIRDPLGSALIRIFRFNNRYKNWAFYDPDPTLSHINTLQTVQSGEVYWIKVYLDIQVTLNNRTMWLFEGWNLVTY